MIHSLSAFITGGTSGIGRAITLRFLSEGINVFAVGKKEQTCNEIKKILYPKYSHNFFCYSADVKNESSIIAAYDAAIQKFNGIDIIIVNAGVFIEQNVENMTTSSFDELINVNIRGAFFTVREGIKYLKKSKGRLIFLTSASALTPQPGLSVYAATKSWLRQFALSIQGELSNDQVRVTVVNPSQTDTKMGRSHSEAIENRVLLTPEEIANAILYCVKHEGNSVIQEINLFRINKWNK